MNTETLKDRLAILTGHERPFAGVERTGIPSSAFNQAWNRNGRLKSSRLSLIGRKIGVCPHTLVVDKGPAWHGEAIGPFEGRLDQAASARNFVLIRTTSSKIDSPAEYMPDSAIGTIASRREWIESTQKKGGVPRMSVMRIQWNSVSPRFEWAILFSSTTSIVRQDATVAFWPSPSMGKS